MPKRIIDNFCTKYTYVGLYEEEAIEAIPPIKLDRIEENDAKYLIDCKNINLLDW